MKATRPLYGRYLHKGDSLTNRNTKRVLDHYFQTSSGLLLGKELEGFCGGCGREKYALKMTEYMGEDFCTDCVSKWRAGGK